MYNNVCQQKFSINNLLNAEVAFNIEVKLADDITVEESYKLPTMMEIGDYLDE